MSGLFSKRPTLGALKTYLHQGDRAVRAYAYLSDLKTRKKFKDDVRFVKSQISDLKNSVKKDGAAMLAVILSTDISKPLIKWTEKLFEGTATIYDKSADATYNLGHEGGALHRLFDGSHSVGGLWEAIKEASPNDKLASEVAGYMDAFLKDVSTVNGLPFFTLSKDSYQTVADALNKSFGISPKWTADIASFNLVELFSTSLGVIALAMNWSKNDKEVFADYATSLGIAAGFSANPLLGIVALASLAKALSDKKNTFSYTQLIKGVGKGGIGAGLILMASNIIAGPAWIGLIVGLILGIYARKRISDVSTDAIARWLGMIFKGATENLKNGVDSIRGILHSPNNQGSD